MPLAFLPHQDVWEEDEPESDYPFGNLLTAARASSKETFEDEQLGRLRKRQTVLTN